MPYDKRRRGGKVQVVKRDDQQVMGTHDSEAKADRQIAALHASESNRKGKGGAS